MNNEITTIEKELQARIKDYEIPTKITTETELKTSADMLTLVKNDIKEIEKKIKEYVSPAKEFIKKVNELGDKVLAPLIDIKINLEKIISEYQIEQKKKHEEELKKKQAEVEAQAKLLEKLAQENEELKQMALDKQEYAKKLDKIEIKASAKSGLGTTTTKMVWTYEIENAELVPREYCSPDAGKIREAVNKGVRDIPGVKIYQKPIVSTRGW